MTKKPVLPPAVNGLRRPIRGRLKKHHSAVLPEMGGELHHIIHTLELHQVELERSHALMQAQLEKYTDLYDYAPVGYITLSEIGLILEINLTASALLRVDRGLLLLQPFSKYIFRGDQDVNYIHLKQLLESGEPQSYELRVIIDESTGSVVWLHLVATITKNHAGETVFRVALRDAPERTRKELYKEISREIQQLLNEPGDLQSLFQRVLIVLKQRTGFDAVGIRLQDGDDYPYFVQQGFPEEFLRTENTLAGHAQDGQVCKDKDGNVSLECFCGLVISGKMDPTNSIFTAGDSFWTNHLCLPAGKSLDENSWFHSRNRCIHHGYASVAWVPIQNIDRNVGLIQINDRRIGCFSLATIELMEGIATHIGKALMRRQAEDLLKRSEQKLHNIINGTNAGTWEWNAQTGETSFDEKSVAILGYTLEEFQPLSLEKWMRLKHPEDRQTSNELLEKHLQGKTDYYSFESRMMHKDGHWVWVLGQGIVIEWDRSGKPLWMFSLRAFSKKF